MRRYAWALAAVLSCAGCANHAPAHSTVYPAVAGETNTIDIVSARVVPAAVALEMPDMKMPAKLYTLHENGAHVYQAANVTFSMAGTWRVSVLDDRGERISSFMVAVR